MKNNASAYFFVLPALCGMLLFWALPLVVSIVLSLTDYRFGSPLRTEWVGLEQYRRLFHDEVFIQAIANNIYFALIVVPLQTCLALLLALWVHNTGFQQRVFRVIFFLPVIFPLSLVSVIWVVLFAPGPGGFINSILDIISFGYWRPVDFLHHAAWALPAVMMASVWQGVGFQFVIVLAALRNIPERLYEAAAVDGAGSRQRFFYITLAQLRPALTFVAITTTILCFRLFDQIQIMTRGGPESTSTTMLYEMVHRAFEEQNIASASAMTVVFFAIILMITLIQARLFRKGMK